MSKTITRKYIQRITKREGNTSIRQSSGGGGGGGGGASQYWVEENYISKLFFNQLFTVYDEDGNIVEPNDTESVIASIKSMFGFWTDAYLSALGNGEGGGAELTLASLADVDVHGVANGQALVYDAYTQKWVPGQAGLDPTSLWQELGSLGTEQISSTHLTTALSTYNPTNNFKTINGYSIIGTGDINVGGGGGSYLPLSGGTLTGSNSDLLILRSTSQFSSLVYNQSVVWSVSGWNNGNMTWWNSSINQNAALLYSTGNLYVRRKINCGGLTPADGNFSMDFSVSAQGWYNTGWVASFGNNIGGVLMGFRNNSYGVIGTSNATNLVIMPDGGNLGIGTTPNTKLHIQGDITVDTTDGNAILLNSSSTFGVIAYICSGVTWSVGNNNSNFTYWNSSANKTVISIKPNGELDVETIVVSGNAKFSGYTGFGYDADSNYRVKVNGVVYASTGVYSGGYVTALSDARHKDVKGDVGLKVGEVANAPSVKFLWKDRRQEGLQVGSIAQYWQKVMPEAIVKNADGELTMSYGVIALLASIATARKVEDHERRIRELEEENKKLKQQLNAA